MLRVALHERLPLGLHGRALGGSGELLLQLGHVLLLLLLLRGRDLLGLRGRRRRGHLERRLDERRGGHRSLHLVAARRLGLGPRRPHHRHGRRLQHLLVLGGACPRQQRHHRALRG